MIASSIDQLIGNTPLLQVKQKSLPSNSPEVFLKLEGNNPAGSVKDRPALNMIRQALTRGDIHQDTPLVEATSGNTGIALAMVASGLRMKLTLLMPENMSKERTAAMRAYGATIIPVSAEGGMIEARDRAQTLAAQTDAFLLDQFNNNDNWKAHYSHTGPEIFNQTHSRVTHVFSAMGTTGTITGISKFLKEKTPRSTIMGVQPSPGSAIPGIRKWPAAYLPGIFKHAVVDAIEEVSLEQAQQGAAWLSQTQGVYAGLSSGGVASVVLRLCEKSFFKRNDTVVLIICDRGDRYASLAS